MRVCPDVPVSAGGIGRSGVGAIAPVHLFGPTRGSMEGRMVGEEFNQSVCAALPAGPEHGGEGDAHGF